MGAKARSAYKYPTDSMNYNNRDGLSGCLTASNKLGKQSNCLTNCPFWDERTLTGDCVLDSPKALARSK